MSESNPFAALVQDENTKKHETKNTVVKSTNLNEILETIFAFTLNEETANKKSYTYLGNEPGCSGKKYLDFSLLPYCLFERLFSPHFGKNDRTDVHSNEKQVIIYLYKCYGVFRRENEVLKMKHENIENFDSVKEEILKNVSTALIHPEIYFDQKLYEQMIEILLTDEEFGQDFFKEVFQAIRTHEEIDDEIMKTIFGCLVQILTTNVTKLPISTFDLRIFSILNLLIFDEKQAELFVDCIEPPKPEAGVNYAKTLLGALLNVSILPKTPSSTFEHFQNVVSQSDVETNENLLWEKNKLISNEIHDFVKILLKTGPGVKNKLLIWIGNCLKSNSDREKLWNSQVSPDFFPANYASVSDGFMVQLGNVMLKLSEPFCKNKKILRVDPTYCAVPNDQQQLKQIHLPNMSEQTCLLPSENERITSNSYSFTTECFFMTHRAIHLGFVVAVDKTNRTNHELGRIERAYNEARLQAAGTPSDIIENLKARLTSEMSKFLSYKAQLTEPNFVISMFDLISATSYWFCQIVLHSEPLDDGKTWSLIDEKPIVFPLPNEVPETLKCIPEFIVGNIVSFIVFVMRFSPKNFEEQGFEKLQHIVTFIVIFMGNNGYVKNPHLRAQLAEALEALLPVHKEEFGPKNDNINYQRTLLFSSYEFKKQMVQSLLEVFVGIEMTGQSVEFEQKFNYRRPMYGVMEYLWEKEDYQNYFRELAEEAERNMDAVSAPIFLRFINLLMNDAVFLLDESLTNMAKLREMQVARDSGEWDRLPVRERTQNLGYLHHTGMIAKFDNILGRDTITALEKLTSKITIVFTHATMVDRIAAMLNYFLSNLVGPNKKNFKVKDQKEYHFDPAETVLKICQIYVNLKENDAFCLAISQDGRSYTSNLFKLAQNVLIRIGGAMLINEIEDLNEKVAKKVAEYQANEEAISEAPEHFLDPIMSTVMTDPVILPSSKQIVDRTTIARHLLSDQTDPFNRSPLSMDQVIPHTELANEIREWMNERQSK